jgi:hypothetical protein
MGTTIFPINNDGPFDEDGPSFPSSAGQGMIETHLLESLRRKSPKQIIKEAEGTLNPSRSKAKKVKTSAKPKNLRVSAGKKKKGIFGETYTPTAAGRKGIRVAESKLGLKGRRMYERMVRNLVRNGHNLHEAERGARLFIEKAPPGWEGTVKKMKKHPEVDNPWALAWHMKGEGDQPHH